MTLYDLALTLEPGKWMLTLEDPRGHVAALYFDNHILIEANTEDFWGRDALGMILAINVARHTILPMPMGIASCLGYTLDDLKESFSNVPVACDATEDEIAFPASCASFASLPGIMTLSRVEKTTYETYWRRSPEEVADAWIADLVQKISALGETLAIGRMERLSVCTEDVRVQASALPKDVIVSVLVTQTDWQTLDSLFDVAVKESSL